MKLWLLKPVENLSPDDNPWRPCYNRAFGFVVRAENEEQARQFAHDEAGDENDGEFYGERTANTNSPWLNKNYSTCIELVPDGKAGTVIRDLVST